MFKKELLAVHGFYGRKGRFLSVAPCKLTTTLQVYGQHRVDSVGYKNKRGHKVVSGVGRNESGRSER